MQTLSGAVWGAGLMLAATAVAVPGSLRAQGNYYTKAEQIKELADPTANVRSPALTEDELYMVFASDQAGGKGGYDLYETSRPHLEAAWAKPRPIDSLNTSADELMPHISYDRREIFFVSYDDPTKIIMKAPKVGRSWGRPRALPSPINRKGYQSTYPATTQDRKTLFLVVNRPPMNITSVIMSSTQTTTGWTTPQPFAPAGKVAGVKSSPIPMANGRRVMFASRATESMGARWYVTHQDPKSGTWIDPYEITELASPASDEGWCKCVSGRFYQSSILSTSGKHQPTIRCYRLDRTTIELCVSTGSTPIQFPNGPWGYVDAWRAVLLTKFELVSYNWYVDQGAAAWFMSPQLSQPLPIPKFGPVPFLLNPSSYFLFGVSPIVNGLAKLPIQMPGNTQLVGHSFFMQGLRVDASRSELTLTGAAEMQIAR